MDVASLSEVMKSEPHVYCTRGRLLMSVIGPVKACVLMMDISRLGCTKIVLCYLIAQNSVLCNDLSSLRYHLPRHQKDDSFTKLVLYLWSGKVLRSQT